MAQNRQRLEQALRAAHQAGDRKGAQRIAQEIRDMDRRATTPGPTVGPVPSPDTPSLQASAMSGIAPVPNRQGIPGADTMQQAKLAAGFLLNANPQARKDMIRNTLGAENVQFEVDEAGRDIVVFGDHRAYINKPGFDTADAEQLLFDIVKFVPAGRVATLAGAAGRGIITTGRGLTRAASVGGLASAFTETVSQLASSLFGSEQGVDPVQSAVAGVGGVVGEVGASGVRGVAGALGRRARFTPAAQDALASAEDLGIGLAAQPGRQVEQVTAAARGMASQQEGQALPAIQRGVQAARETERRAAGRLFDEARAGQARITKESTEELNARLRHGLDDFDFGAPGMRDIGRQVDYMTGLATDDITDIPLNELERARRRIRAMRPKEDSPARAAATRALSVYDTWLDDLFNRDMVLGNADDIAKWTRAREAWTAYRNRFDAHRVIKDLGRKETTAEQMSQWLFNANAIGAKREAGLVVEKLNDILGPRSAEMGQLRADVILDIAEPLFKDTPDIVGFVNNYRRWLGRNPTLKKNLFPDELGEQFDDLARWARVISQRPGTRVRDLTPGDISTRLVNWVNRVLIGHGIARGGARVQAGGIIANAIRSVTGGPAARRRALQEYLGVDPTRQIIPMPTTIGASAAVTADREQ